MGAERDVFGTGFDEANGGNAFRERDPGRCHGRFCQYPLRVPVNDGSRGQRKRHTRYSGKDKFVH